jgi:lipid II:glycine glycyltransferase (peptidoglycan interpeptide bridge formation enzyme)
MKLEEISPQDLDKFVKKQHPEANFLQTSNWGKVHELAGDRVFYLKLWDGEEVRGTCVATLKQARRGRYIEIPGGPLIEWGSRADVRAVMDGLKKLAAQENCVFVRMRPNMADTAESRKIFAKAGLVTAVGQLHAEHTIMIDLGLSEDKLLAGMRRQTRYEVRRAAKLGIKVSYATDEKAFKEFYRIQKQTAERQGFVLSPEKLILAQREVFGDNARIYRAELDGKPLALALVLMQKPEAIYHEAASTEAGRKLPGAYALQWQIMQDAKAIGLRRYNLFGIAPPNNPKHRYAGVTTFKMGFGGEPVAYVPAQDLVVEPMKYKMVKLIEGVRKWRRHL